MKDDIFKYTKYLESHLKEVKERERIMEPMRSAAREMELSGIKQYAQLSTYPPNCLIETVSSAYLNNTYQFGDAIEQQLRDIYAPLENACTQINEMATILGVQFQNLVQPSVYLPYSNDIQNPIDNMASELSSAVSIIDTSWMQQINPWVTEAACLSKIDTSILAGTNIVFSNLIQLEQETSNLPFVVDYFPEITSVSVQLASMGKALSGIKDQWKEIIAPLHFLDDYNNFALHQHIFIQKAANLKDNKSIEWRLNLLDVTSRFIDRQITWRSEFVTDIQEDIDLEDIMDIESELDIAAIPQYLGYSKRDNIVVDEAFAESSLVVVTEKGKKIVDRAQAIKKLCQFNNSPILFENADSYIGSYMVLAGSFCRNVDSLNSVVEALYHLFYDQREKFSLLLDLNEFKCIEIIKTLKDGKQYPNRAKEISNLQYELYEQFLKFEEVIIEKLGADIGDHQSLSSTTPLLIEDKWSEQTISNNIFKALCHIQKNNIFWGKEENRLNDGVRDNLSMIYEMKDQTRQGISSNGEDAGELDLQICKEGYPMVIIESLKVDSLKREYIKDHIDKAFTKYDPVGCPYIYIIIYSTAKNFARFWKKCLNYIRNEYVFPYTIKEGIYEMNHAYTESRHAKTVLLRNDKEVAVHFFTLSVQ